MSYDRAEHLADVNRDIQNWQAEVKRLELEVILPGPTPFAVGLGALSALPTC